MVKDIIEYATSMKLDLIEQFKDKPNIEVLLNVMARQLQEVYDFYLQLMTLLSIDQCEGAQLDNIGDIVQMTRVEARALADGSDFTYTDEDEMYRAFLYYKIFINTADCTYEDVMHSIYMMWDGLLEYAEEPDVPATIILGYEMFNGDNHRKLLSIPILKAGGVQILFRAKANMEDRLKVGGGVVESNSSVYAMTERTSLPNYLCDEDYNLLCDEKWWILCEMGDDE